jgi:lipopolysaccharide export system protein LptA
MSGRNFIRLAALGMLLALFPACLWAADRKLIGRGPIVITSSSFSVDNRANTAVFEGSVVAKTENMTLYADRMTVHYTASGEAEVIEAEGTVRLVRGEQAITSGKAVYHAVEDKVIFTENPRAIKGANVITGSRMTYFIEQDRSVVEDSRVFIERGEK